ERAAELGHSASTIQISDMILGEEIELDPREAARWIRRAAEAGDADAQVTVGVRLGVRGHHVEAMSWYRAAAKQGDRDAWHNLGQMSREGEATEPSWRKALPCYRRAALQGHEEGFYWLVEYYEGRCGSPRNTRRAAEWLRRAERMARDGHENVCAFLGEYYGGKDAD